MRRSKNLLKLVLPYFLIKFVKGLFYGWYGNYASWELANKKCTGYNADSILEKVKESTNLVKSGKAIFERDSYIFDKIEYSYTVLTGFLWIAAQNNGKINILDFEGALGSSYFQNKKFLDTLKDVKWCIVEQANFVKVGLEQFEDDRLKFYYNIDSCLREHEIDLILLSSVLQYIETPYDLLDEIKTKNIKYLIVDRTPFIKGNDRITVQKVDPAIYKASYPCWFFNEKKFLNHIQKDYELIIDFDSLDQANIRSKFKGFIFQKKLN